MMANLLLSTCLGLCLLSVALAQGTAQKTVSSRTRSLYRVTPKTKEQMEFMSKFIAFPEVIILSPMAQIGSDVDILIPRNLIPTVLEWFNENGIDEPKLVDKRVKISYSTPYVEKYRTLPVSRVQRRLEPTSGSSPMLRDDLPCNSGNYDMSTCRGTGCITAFEHAASICERWIGDKRYHVYSSTQSYCWFFTTDYRCCLCKDYE